MKRENQAKGYLILNTITLLFALVMNYLSGTGVFGGRSVADVSAKYSSLFTPAGYAFAIWGVIYLLLIAFVVYQWVAWIRHKDDRELKQTGIWFALANVANGLWIVAWLNLYIGWSVVLIFILLLSLIVLTVRLRLELWDAPVRIIAFVWWPICIYLGWIIVASVANVTVFLVSLGWEGGFLSPAGWAIAMIGVATIIYLLLLHYRNMREAALVGVWALIAIAVRQWSQQPEIVGAALVASAFLLIIVASHASKNHETLPLKKIKRGEI